MLLSQAALQFFCIHARLTPPSAVPLALYVTYLGCTAWFSSTASTPSERILGANAAGLHLSQLQLSVLLLWDIPTGFAVKALRDPIMLCHHVGFAVTAYAVTQTCNETYALVFFGVAAGQKRPLPCSSGASQGSSRSLRIPERRLSSFAAASSTSTQLAPKTRVLRSHHQA
jgi:hypothetical protein